MGAEEYEPSFLLPLRGDVGAPACSFGSVSDDRQRPAACSSASVVGFLGSSDGLMRWDLAMCMANGWERSVMECGGRELTILPHFLTLVLKMIGQTGNVRTGALYRGN
jgi:hypothetical protein